MDEKRPEDGPQAGQSSGEAKGNPPDRPPWLTEPWTKLMGADGKVIDGVRGLPQGLVGGGRRLIKTLADAPHLVIAIPVGNKEDTDVLVDPNTNERRVMPGYRYPGLIPAELLYAKEQMMTPLNISSTIMMLKNNISAILREIMTKEALRIGANFIFYWDDDVLPPTDTLYKMLNKMAWCPDIGAITGVVWTKMYPTEPLIYKDASTGAYWGMSRDPAAEPEDIYSCGAGCLMARVAAIRKMSPPYWHDEHGVNEHGHLGILGHDVRFVRKMRMETGYRVTVDGSIQCRHYDIRSQCVFEMPANMPTMADARDAADLHAKITEEEAQAVPPGPVLPTPTQAQTVPGPPDPRTEYVEPVAVEPDLPFEQIEKLAVGSGNGSEISPEKAAEEAGLGESA